MHNDGVPNARIAKGVDLDPHTVSKIISESKAKAPAGKKEEPKGAKTKSDQDILTGATDAAAGKIKEDLSKQMFDDYKISIETAKVIKAKALQYKTNVETMGMDWNEFVSFAMDSFYGLCEDEFLRLRSRITEEDVLTAQLQLAEIREIGKNGR